MRKLSILLSIFVLLGMASTASALSLSYGDSYYLGYIWDGIPSSLDWEAVYINNLTTLSTGAGPTTIDSETYDRTESSLTGPFPFPDALTATKPDDSGGTSFSAIGQFYILGKYDGPNAGSLVWFKSDGFTGDITLVEKWGPTILDEDGQDITKLYGISHISALNQSDEPPETPIPEPGTMLLLGAGLITLAGFSRKKFIK